MCLLRFFQVGSGRKYFMNKGENEWVKSNRLLNLKSSAWRREEVKSAFLPLRREVRAMRLRLSSLSKSFRVLDRLAKEEIIPKAGERFKLEASAEEVKGARITPARIRILRRKLGISQRELGVLTGASMGTVVMWEKGKFKPKADKKGALIALRKLGKRQVKKMLAEKSGGGEPQKRAPRKPRRRPAGNDGAGKKMARGRRKKK